MPNRPRVAHGFEFVPILGTSHPGMTSLCTRPGEHPPQKPHFALLVGAPAATLRVVKSVVRPSTCPCHRSLSQHFRQLLQAVCVHVYPLLVHGLEPIRELVAKPEDDCRDVRWIVPGGLDPDNLFIFRSAGGEENLLLRVLKSIHESIEGVKCCLTRKQLPAFF